MRARRALLPALLFVLVAVHFVSRLQANLVTPLSERHFYSESYYVALSLLHGGGFRYLVPEQTVFRTADLFPDGSAALRPGDPRAPVVEFIQLAGRESVSLAELAAYASTGTMSHETGPIETTRILDIRLTAVLWRLFGTSWTVYFAFYSLVSAAAAFSCFLIARGVTGSFWCGFAAAAGLLSSPLEHYAGVWSTRDTVPLWFTCIAFAALTWFLGRPRSGLRALLGAMVVGFSSLVGLGWRPDFQLLPPLFLATLVVVLAARRESWRGVGTVVSGFLVGCLLVLVLLRALGPASYSQGATVFHTAWYGEASRSNLLGTENVFQAARDDYQTLYQAHYYAGARAGGHLPAPRKDEQHYRRCREMFLHLARYNAWSWWSAFPSFLVRGLQIDKPTLFGNVEQAAAFRARRLSWLAPFQREVLDRYGRVLPWLVGVGLVGGLLVERTRWLTALMACHFVYNSAAILLVLPEPKHTLPLLLPIHVLAALGLWHLARAARAWRSWPRAARGRHLAIPALAFAGLLAAWGLLGLAARHISGAERANLVESVRQAEHAGSSAAPVALEGKVLRLQPGGDTAVEGYLLDLRAARLAQLLCLHVREPLPGRDGLTYYTRHSITPGSNSRFFVSLVSGQRAGDPRPYTLYVRFVGPVELTSVRRLDLSGWQLGLPLSFVFDEADGRAAPDRLLGPGAATEHLPASEIGHLLTDPSAFLRSYRSE